MSSKPLPGHDKQPDDITCSSCGRFVGALTRCPHCGAHVQKRMSVRFFRYAALLMATVGLFLLYLMAVNKDVPIIKVDEIRPTMNFAYVRIVGVIVDDTRIYRRGDKLQSLRFTVDDGTGEIPVTAYRAQAETLIEKNMVPRMGDGVEVAGSLSVSADDRVLLRVQVPEQVVLTRIELPVTALGDLTDESEGSSIVVEGVISRVSAPGPNSRAPWTLTVQDDTGSQQMTFWEDVYADITDKILVAPGTPVRARVSVGSHKGKLQLRLTMGMDLEFPGGKAVGEVVAGPGAPAVEVDTIPLGDVTADMVGRDVAIEGRVVSVRAPDEGSQVPHTIELEDEGARVTVVYWDAVASRLGDRRPVEGAWVRVRGEAGVYRDKVQVKVQRADHVSFLEVPPAREPEEPAGEPVPIGEIDAGLAGKQRTLQGTLGEPRSIKNGVIYPLTDESGTIQLLLWDRSVPGSDREELQAGRKVTVSGEIKEYRGELEIVPASPRAIQLEDAP